MSAFQPPSEALTNLYGWKADAIAQVLGKLINNAKHRAKVKKVPFDLSYSRVESLYVAQKGLCFYSGREMDIFPNSTKQRRRRLAISMDRLNPKLGY